MEAAIDDFEHAIHINPNYIKAYLNRGLARYKLGDQAGANQDFYHVMCVNADAYVYYQAQRSTASSEGYSKNAPQVEVNQGSEYFYTTFLNGMWDTADLDQRKSMICEAEFIND
jgi:tetratricopeptide (TPR) repeat protein